MDTFLVENTSPAMKSKTAKQNKEKLRPKMKEQMFKPLDENPQHHYVQRSKMSEVDMKRQLDILFGRIKESELKPEEKACEEDVKAQDEQITYYWKYMVDNTTLQMIPKKVAQFKQAQNNPIP